tara:strand:- start:563 stop:691 length:129 start_codon:yes stop_codon:yes gene_type:complete
MASSFTLLVGFHGVNTNINHFLLQIDERKGYIFPQQNVVKYL